MWNEQRRLRGALIDIRKTECSPVRRRHHRERSDLCGRADGYDGGSGRNPHAGVFRIDDHRRLLEQPCPLLRKPVD